MDNPHVDRPNDQACQPDGQNGEAKTAAAFMPGGEAHSILTVETAHEFSNLLTIVLSSLEALQRQPLDDHGWQQLARAERGTRQLCALHNRCSPLSELCSR